MNRDQLAARLLRVFLAELEEQQRAFNAGVLALEAEPGSSTQLGALFRVTHTLKGAATAAGVPLIREVCHALETLLAQARDGKRRLGHDEFALLFSAADALQDAGERLRNGTPLAGSPLEVLAQQLSDPPGTPRLAPPRPSAHPLPSTGPRATGRVDVPAAPPPPPAPPWEPSAAAAAGARTPTRAQPHARAADHVRVETEKLGALLASAGQIRRFAAELAARAAEIRQLHAAVEHATTQWRAGRRRLAQALGEVETADPARRWLERVDEGLKQTLEHAARLSAAAAADARGSSRLADELSQRAMQLRLRPFSDACEHLPRVLRDTTRATGKEAKLEIRGGEVEADRAVLQGLGEALLHLVRNAVDHGIEPPETRERMGKPRAGRVQVAASLRADRLVITVSDDGAGIDLDRVRERALQYGWDVPTDASELVQLLFRGGFSTRAETTEVSGRGVGLDVVRSTLERLRGSVDVRWTPGGGATFVLECPLTLATSRVLLVRVGTQSLAIPTAFVERMLRVLPAQIRRAGGRDVIPGDAAPIPVVSLARLLGPPLPEPAADGAVPVVRLLSGDRRLAVLVDELLGEKEVVVRPIQRLSRLPFYLSGAAILGADEVTLVLNPAGLVAEGLKGAADSRIGHAAAGVDTPAKRVLVVDDSISTRTLEQSILESAGYQVLTAVDGLDAWRVLQQEQVDLVVSDIEMPRMDGFALCEAIRGSRRMAELPVVLVTALESDAHRARGLEAGADAYILKSSFDQQNLLDVVQQLIGEL